MACVDSLKAYHSKRNDAEDEQLALLENCCGKYYQPLASADRKPVVKSVLTSAHPIKTLIEAGIIEQRGTFQGTDYVFNPNRNTEYYQNRQSATTAVPVEESRNVNIATTHVSHLEKMYVPFQDTDTIYNPATGAPPFVPESKLQTSTLVAPKSVIRVLGSLQPHLFVPEKSQEDIDNTHKKVTSTFERYVKMKEKQKKIDLASSTMVFSPTATTTTTTTMPNFVKTEECDVLEMSVSGVDGGRRKKVILKKGEDQEVPPEENALTEMVSIGNIHSLGVGQVQKREQLRLVKQYIMRAIPAAAEKTKALIINEGQGVLGEVLGMGVSKAMAAWTLGIKLLSVSGRQSRGDEAKLLPTYSHHLLLLEKDKFRSRSAEGIETRKPGAPSAQEVTRYTKEILSELASGKLPRHGEEKENGGNENTNGRTGSCVVGLVVGGDALSLRTELLYFVKKSWPIFIVEKSSGYAEYLGTAIRRIEEVTEHPSIDDYRTMLGSVDASTAEILVNGDVTLIRVGTSCEEVARMFELALCGNPTLRLAWEKYDLWHKNALSYSSMLWSFQVLILLLGICATGISIFQTFLQLQYPERTIRSTDAADSITQIYQWLNLILIALPVLASLFQAVLLKVDPANKAVVLRRCSEVLLREIYLYRTQTRSYSQNEILASQHGLKKEEGAGSPEEGGGANNEGGTAGTAGGATEDTERHEEEEATANNAGDGAEPSGEGGGEGGDSASNPSQAASKTDKIDESILNWADNEPYFSREDLLDRRMETLTQDVIENVSDSSLKTLAELLGKPVMPPSHIRASGDDGFTDLDPRSYVAYRLMPAIEFYRKSVGELERSTLFLNNIIYVFGAMGTMLAAVALLASLKAYNLQAWVALTTALQNALTRYLDYSRMEWLFKQYSKTQDMLTNVQSWWAQLQQPGQNADSQANRTKMVSKVEVLISSEVEESGHQTRSMTDKMKKAQAQQKKELESTIDKLKSGEDVDKVKMMKEAGLQDITPANLAAALSDPGGKAAKEIRQSMTRVMEQVDLKPLSDELISKKRVEQLQSMNKIISTIDSKYLNEARKLKDVNLGGIKLAEFLPVDLMNKLKDPQLQQKLFSAVEILDSRQMVNRQMMLKTMGSALGKGKEIYQRIADLAHRQLLVLAKDVAEKKMLLEFEYALKGMGLDFYDIVPTRSKSDVFVGELKTVAALNWRETSIEQLLLLIKDEKIRQNLTALGEASVRGIFKRAERFFLDSGAVVLLLETTIFDIATLDVNELFQTATDRVERANIREKALAVGKQYRFELMSKSELLELLPTRMRALDEVIKQSPGQLAAYVREIANGSLTLQILDNVFQSYREEKGSNAVVTQFLQSADRRQCLLEGIRSIPTPTIYEANKDWIIRTLSISPTFTQQMGNDLRGMTQVELKELIQFVKGSIATAFPAQLFEIVADQIVSMDLRTVVGNWDLRINLMDRAQQFRGGRVKDLNKKQILSTIADPALVSIFHVLTEEQLEELVESVILVTSNKYALYCVAEAVNTATELNEIEKMKVEHWNDFQCARLVHSVLHIRRSMKYKQSASNLTDQAQSAVTMVLKSEYDLTRLPDNSISQFMVGLSNTSQSQVINLLLQSLADASTDKYFKNILLMTEGSHLPSNLHALLANNSSGIKKTLLRFACEVCQLVTDQLIRPWQFSSSSQETAVQAQSNIAAMSDQINMYINDLAFAYQSIATCFTEEQLQLFIACAVEELHFGGSPIFWASVVNACPQFDLQSLIPEPADEADLITAWILYQAAVAAAPSEQNPSPPVEHNSLAVVGQGIVSSPPAEHPISVGEVDKRLLLKRFDEPILPQREEFFAFLSNRDYLDDYDEIEFILRSLEPSDFDFLMKGLQLEYKNSMFAKTLAELRIYEYETGKEASQQCRKLQAAVGYLRRPLGKDFLSAKGALFGLDVGTFQTTAEFDREMALASYISHYPTMRWVVEANTEQAKALFSLLYGIRQEARHSSNMLNLGEVLKDMK